MTAVTGWAALCGVALGFGLWLLLSLVPRLSPPRLADRIAPYLIDISSDARELLDRRPLNPLPVLGVALEPALDAIRHGLIPLLGGSATIALRLRQAGSTLGVEEFRSRQLLWEAGGALAGILGAVAAGRAQSVPLPLAVAGILLATVAGFLLRDWLLARAARARVARVSSELPSVLEFLALSVSAGEGILDGLRRVATVSRGELAAEFAAVISEVNTGVPIARALRRMASELQVAPLSRVVDQIVGALDRGTPLVEVLAAQAQDSRDEAKRELIEVAGRKEVAMLVPLVFLILPVTIAFAIFPGVMVLQLGF